MKLTVLPKRVYLTGQLGKELAVEPSAYEPARQLEGIAGGYDRAHSGRDHRLGEVGGVFSPYREERSDTGIAESLFPVTADIFQEQVAERDVRRVQVLWQCLNLFQKALHGGLILGVGTWRRYRYLVEGQAEFFRLQFQDPAWCGVDGYAVEGRRYGREYAAYVVALGLLSEGVKCPGGILAGRPRDEDRYGWHRGDCAGCVHFSWQDLMTDSSSDS